MLQALRSMQQRAPSSLFSFAVPVRYGISSHPRAFKEPPTEDKIDELDQHHKRCDRRIRSTSSYPSNLSIYRYKAFSPTTRVKRSEKFCTDPYEDPDKPRPKYPKRKSPFKRAQAIIDALNEEEKVKLVKEGRAVFPKLVGKLKPGDIVRVGYSMSPSATQLRYFSGICMAIRNKGLGKLFYIPVSICILLQYSMLLLDGLETNNFRREAHYFYTSLILSIFTGSSFILRNVVDGIPIERAFPTYSPLIKDAAVIGHRDVRRNKLYYLREKPLRESTFSNALQRPQISSQ